MEFNKRSSAPSNMIYGIKPIEEAFKAGKYIDKIFVQRNLKSDDILDLLRLASDNRVAVAKVPVEKINNFTMKNHQGIVAFVSAISYAPLENILASAYEAGEVPLILLLDRITDVRNFGAIARTAECMGVHAIVVPIKGGAQAGPDAVKTSAGALNHIPVCREGNLKQTVTYLQDYGLQVFACSEKGSEKDTIYSAKFDGPTAIVMGSEEDGISDDIIRIADRILRIPMTGKISSLNVSVATGMFLSEVVRQRSL